MRRVAAGDRHALAVLFERHAGLVHRTAYRYLWNEEDARDVTQSVFVTLMQSAHRYEPRAKLSTWLYRIVVNRCLNHRAKLQRRERLAAALPPDEEASEDQQPDRAMVREAQRERVQEALLDLPERQRIAVVLSRFEGMRYDEIAEAMGCSESSVESLLFRARASLRKKLSE